MTRLPSSWHKVRICSDCELVVHFANLTTKGDDWEYEYRYCSNNRCLNCGEQKFIETVAAWYDNSYWWMPWTSKWGYWELKQTRDRRLAMEKGLKPMRKEFEANN